MGHIIPSFSYACLSSLQAEQEPNWHFREPDLWKASWDLFACQVGGGMEGTETERGEGIWESVEIREDVITVERVN